MAASAARGESGLSRNSSLALKAATPDRLVVPCYEKLELTLDLSATYENPFDADEIDVHARFTSPVGKQIQVNGFLYQPFTRRLENNAEQIEPAGEPVWKLRFTPDLAGDWKYQVSARDRSGSARLPETQFKAVKSDHPGFIRRSARNPLAFAWDNGRPFFAVGENMCWAAGRGSFDYDQWLPELGKAGGNFIRIWMSSWNCALEWSRPGKGESRSGEYEGVGRYSLGNAWKLEAILDAAERQGVNVMLCLGTYGEFTSGGFFNEGQWNANPYKQSNGGPCDKPGDFWTNATARKLYQRRLRYLAARYGHRTNLQAWEFWNEAKAPAAWIAEMARCFRGTGEFQGRPADPYGHLVTTTYGTSEVWKIPELDFTQTHSYGKGDIPDHAPVVQDDARKHAIYRKPHIMAEFGIDWRGPDSKYDPDGLAVNLHNGLWASVCSGEAGTAMIWWWDNYVHPKALYNQYAPVRRFVDAVPWTRGEWKPLALACVSSSKNLTDSTGAAVAPKTHAYGLINGRRAIAWLQNAEHNWKNVLEKHETPALENLNLSIQHLPSGRYRVDWWDTRRGEVTGRETAKSVEERLTLPVPHFAQDIALQIIGEDPSD
jgi:hypothetical protein